MTKDASARFRKELSAERLAQFKSRTNELRMIRRLLINGEINIPAACRELDRVQCDLHSLSRTDRRRND